MSHAIRPLDDDDNPAESRTTSPTPDISAARTDDANNAAGEETPQGGPDEAADRAPRGPHGRRRRRGRGRGGEAQRGESAAQSAPAVEGGESLPPIESRVTLAIAADGEDIDASRSPHPPKPCAACRTAH